MEGENRKTAASGGILISILMITSMLTFPTTPGLAVAENPEIIVIVRGKEAAFNYSHTGDKPWRWYKAGDHPPIVIAQKVGNGMVVAAGVAASVGNIEDAPEHGRWNDARPGRENPLPHLDVLLDKVFQWMAPGAKNVLWYEGYGVYYNTTSSSHLVKALRALGYTITGDGAEPITSSLLAPYDILVIPQLQLGHPDDLPDADVAAIKSFVEGGKGLLIMEGSDYRGMNYYKVQNKILTALGVELLFQSDEMNDTENRWVSGHQPIVDVDATTEVGAKYQAAIGKSILGLYRPCTLAPPVPTGVAVSIIETEPTPSDKVDNNFRPTLATARPGEKIVTVIRVSNVGTVEDSYAISATDDLGWRIEVSPATLTVPPGGGSDVVVKITVDPAVKEKVKNLIVITARGTGVEDTTVLSTSPHLPLDEPPWTIFGENEYFYQFSTPSLIVGPPAQPIIIGTETSCTLDETQREPYPTPFGKGEFPVVAAASGAGNGRVIAYGPAAGFRSAPTDHFSLKALKMGEFGLNMIGWLARHEDPAGLNVLFYWTPGAFHDGLRCARWLDHLRAQGYNVHTFSDGITAERLALYDVLMLITPERPLSDDEIEAIRDWVLAGGGLFLGEQADYGAYAKPLHTNPIFEALGVNIRFQDDQVTDNEDYNRWPWEPRVYLVDHEVWYPPYAFSAHVRPEAMSVIGGGGGVFTLTITNKGTEADTYRIKVTSKLGWRAELEREEITLPSGQSGEVRITVTSPIVGELTKDDFTVEVTGTRGSASAGFRLAAEPPKPGESWTVIAAAIVVVAFIAVAFLALRKKRIA